MAKPDESRVPRLFSCPPSSTNLSSACTATQARSGQKPQGDRHHGKCRYEHDHGDPVRRTTAPRVSKPVCASACRLHMDVCQADTPARDGAIVDWAFLNSQTRHDTNQLSAHRHHPCNSRVRRSSGHYPGVSEDRAWHVHRWQQLRGRGREGVQTRRADSARGRLRRVIPVEQHGSLQAVGAAIAPTDAPRRVRPRPPRC